MSPTDEKTTRLFDLVRHQRMELHEAGLITDGEYVLLAQEKGLTARLESYDEIRAEIAALKVKARDTELRWMQSLGYFAQPPIPYDEEKAKLVRESPVLRDQAFRLKELHLNDIEAIRSALRIMVEHKEGGALNAVREDEPELAKLIDKVRAEGARGAK